MNGDYCVDIKGRSEGWSEKELEVLQKESKQGREKERGSKGLLTQQELSAKARVRQGASAYVRACGV